MKLTVYEYDYSPYCIPIAAALKALRVPHRVVQVPEQDRSIIIKLSKGRFYQVPFLMHGKKAIGESSGDSIDIARYIDRVFARRRLFPKDKEGLQRIFIPYIENEVEMTTFKLSVPHIMLAKRNLVDRVHSIRFRERRFGRGCTQKWIADAPALRREALRLLEPFELMARENPFLLGDAPVYTDYAVYGILGNMTYGGYQSFPARFKTLAAWQKRLKAWRFK